MRTIGVLTAFLVGLSSLAAAQATTPGQPIQPQPSYSDEIAHPQMPRGNGHPRNVRILPRSRDFH